MMAYSPDADRFVLFGGSDGEPTNSTWVLEPSSAIWTQLHPNVAPPVRVDGMFVYDSRAHVFVLFGGWFETIDGAYVRRGDTWAFDLGTDSWTPLHPTASPSPRSDSAIAYDPVADATLLFGGFNGTTYLGDAWAFTLANESWWPHNSSLMPSPRADGRMTYAAEANAFFLYGGNDYSGPGFTYHHLGDTWRYRWADRQWTELFPSLTPGALDYAVLAADTVSGVLLMSGGYGASVVLGDTWAFNVSRGDWRLVSVPTGPSPRMAGVGGYDPVDDVFVVFSGADTVSAKDDTWVLRFPPTLVAIASASLSEPAIGESVDFAANVTGGTGFVTRAAWAFGDGVTANGTRVSHAFSAPGTYSVRFTVVDDRGQTSSSSVQITVGSAVLLWFGLAGAGVALAIGLTALGIIRRRLRAGRRKRVPDPVEAGGPVEDSPGKPL
jgi:PKD domain/Galactose oxidase, central domain